MGEEKKDKRHFDLPVSHGKENLQRSSDRTHHAGESVPSFVAKLRKLSEHCNFGEEL